MTPTDHVGDDPVPHAGGGSQGLSTARLTGLLNGTYGQTVAANGSKRHPITGWHHVTGYGAKGDGSSDDTAAFQAAIAAASADNAPIYCQRPSVAYKITATLQTFKNMVIFGDSTDRPSDNGTQITCAFNGALFQQGTDNGQASDSNTYDGPEGLKMRDLYLKASAAGTTLTFDGVSTYSTGTYGIRDWRGGDVTLDRVYFEGFDYWFWGIQSDLNTFRHVEVRHCKSGFYLGPRSDQNTFYDFYPTLNDKVGTIDCARGTTFYSPKFVGNGHATSVPLTLTNASTVTTTHDGTTIVAPWFEHNQGATTIEAFIEIGVGDTTQVTGLAVIDPVILTGTQGSSNYAQYLLKTDNCTDIFLDIAAPSKFSILAGLIKHTGTTSPGGCVIQHPFVYRANTPITTPVNNTGSGTLDPLMVARGSSYQHFSRSTSAGVVMRFSRNSNTNATLEINTDGQLRLGPGNASSDTQIVRGAAGVVAVGANTQVFRTGSNTTANRPGPSTAGAGGLYVDTTLGCLTYSDGTNWRRADTNAIV